uniref:Ribosomal protein S6 n=1 Tax=Climaconeis cf. scalaris TaxID=2846828 RepID=A0A8F8SQX7_9STRA|nr:ribosomal protein S6 [Climaconeis cf. scalaris]QYB19123.1 ribosomal protein S6 [Climaconeis cf. scalaris]
MSFPKKYEIMVLLIEEFNENELKIWVLNYGKNLRKFNACEISVVSRGKQKLAYDIKKKLRGTYIQFNFSSMPKYIFNFSEMLNMDSNVLRFSAFKK